MMCVDFDVSDVTCEHLYYNNNYNICQLISVDYSRVTVSTAIQSQTFGVNSITRL